MAGQNYEPLGWNSSAFALLTTQPTNFRYLGCFMRKERKIQAPALYFMFHAVIQSFTGGTVKITLKDGLAR